MTCFDINLAKKAKLSGDRRVLVSAISQIVGDWISQSLQFLILRQEEATFIENQTSLHSKKVIENWKQDLRLLDQQT